MANETSESSGLGYPSSEAAAVLYDQLDYQRAVQAYVWAVPMVNGVALERALVAAGVTPDEPSLLVFDHTLTPRQVLMTANSEVVYGMSVIDLAATGPVVVDAPPGGAGVVCDLWMRGVVDIGIGPGKDQRILVLPPGHPGGVRGGYYVARARTAHVFVLLRGIVLPGQSTDAFVELVSSMKIHRLGREDDPTAVIRNGGRPFDSDWPKDERYFGYIAEGLGSSLPEECDKVMYAMLAPLGIGPAAAAPPDDRAREVFQRAAETGARMVSTLAFASRTPIRLPWPGRRWEPINSMTSAEAETDVSIELDQRAQGFYQLVGNGLFGFTMKAAPNLTAAVPGTGATSPGVGQTYVQSYKDATGAYLDGTHGYRLRIPSEPPVKLFWSATVYDVRTRSMIDTGQQKAGLSTYSGITKNQDGTIDLYFAPEPPAGHESNWIQTIPGVGFFVMFRLYGPLEPALDGTWKLADIERHA
jgi:hypothetical protein